MEGAGGDKVPLQQRKMLSADHLTKVALKELSERRNLRAQEMRDRMPGEYCGFCCWWERE